MEIQSSVFSNGGEIPQAYTCDGSDVNPPLYLLDVPKETKSLALIMDDPDAPMGLWVHWVMWNIDPETRHIAENSVPQGAREGLTSAGRGGYHGPCPPDREHRYFFRLYAVDTVLDLDVLQTGKEELKDALHGHVLAQAELMGVYGRPHRNLNP
jgi:Raf kinase inhibitor-like YbhB/YbcL family protein